MPEVKLTAEWCRRNADFLDQQWAFWRKVGMPEEDLGDLDPDYDAAIAAALNIAARVLDEGAEERLARMIADGLGDDLDHAFVNKGEWNRCRGEKGGRYRDINEPMLDDYLAAARAVLAHIRGAG